MIPSKSLKVLKQASLLLIIYSLIGLLPAKANSSQERETLIDEYGITNPIEESIEYQLEKMKTGQTNGTLTVLCWKAHELRKAGQSKKAYPALLTCAKNGHDISMLYLANMYETGSGVEQNYVTAASWLKRTSDRGFSSGQLYYGIALILGKGVKQDIETGKELIRKAAAQDDQTAKDLILANFNVSTVIPDGVEHNIFNKNF